MMSSVDIAITARDEASRVFGQVGRSAAGFGSTIKRAMAAAGLYIGTREIIGFVKGTIAAYAEQEIAVRHLADALANLGIIGGETINDLQIFADLIQQTSIISDEAAIELMSLGVSMGQFSDDTLKAATIAAIGFSKAFKTDLEAAMRLVSKSAQGITTGLKRYGIVVDETMTTSELFHSVLVRGSELYNVATGEINTQQGSILQLKNQWHDLKEKMGETLNGPVRYVIDAFRVMIVVIDNWRLAMNIAWVSFKLGLVQSWEELKYDFGTAIPTLLIYFSDNWRQVFMDLWNMTRAVFTNMWGNIKDFFISVWGWLNGEEISFEWTGLLEGFESTLKEMPKIAAREISGLEISLTGQLDEMKLEMSRKIVETFSPTPVDIAEIVKNAILPEGVRDKAGKGKKESGAPKAEESRFLTFAPGARYNGTEKNTSETAKNTNQIAKTLGLSHKKLEELSIAIKAMTGASLITVTDFK